MAGPRVVAETSTLRHLFEAGTYNIEYYQREYAWTSDEVSTLLGDLVGQFVELWKSGRYPGRNIEPYFLGPFVFYEERRGSRFLVDGQQRFTTLHLMFIHLYRMARDFDDAASADRLSRVIVDYDDRRPRFRIDIRERQDALRKYYEGQGYEPPPNASLSLRNLCRRFSEIVELLDADLDSTTFRHFVAWLLNHVVLVAIQATSRDNGFRIFESMNDRGAQLTQVDLVKSFLLSSVRTAEEELNKRWREMLAAVTQVREDRDAPRKFLVAALIAHWAEYDEGKDPAEQTRDEVEIERAVNAWIRSLGRDRIGLHRPDDFFTFVDQLIGLSGHYVTFVRASGKPYHENKLESVFYNRVNGLDNQFRLLLAAVRPEDTPSDAIAKASLVARYIDRLYVLRALEFEPVDSKSFDREVRRLVPQLRRCQTPEDIRSLLSANVEASDFIAIRDYRMQGNNKPQIRYILARLTSHVQRGCNKPDPFVEYVGPERTWEIEHLWPNLPELHKDDVGDPVVFRTLRSMIGSLVLLPGRDNNSLNAMPLPEKISRYGRQNALVAVLERNYRRNHPDFNDFARSNRVEKLFREFGPNATIEQIVRDRTELYRLLCIRIWNPGDLGFPIDLSDEVGADQTVQSDDADETAVPRAPAKPARRRLLQTDVAKMVRAGIFASGTLLSARVGTNEYTATVDEDGRIVLSTGVAYDKVDEAARTATGKRQDGMAFWRVAVGGAVLSLRDLKSRSMGTNRARARR